MKRLLGIVAIVLALPFMIAAGSLGLITPAVVGLILALLGLMALRRPAGAVAVGSMDLTPLDPGHPLHNPMHERLHQMASAPEPAHDHTAHEDRR